jgi:glycosyltransferase involved in cell wall biosynthesis
MNSLHLVRRIVSSDLNELTTGYDLEHFKSMSSLMEQNIVIFQAKDKKNHKITFNNLTIYLVPNTFSLLTFPFKIKKSFDIIIGQNPFLGGFIAIMVGKFLRKPVIISIHGYEFTVGRIQNSLKKIVCLNATKIRANSKIVKKTICSWGINKDKITIIEDRVNCDHFNPNIDGLEIRKQLGIKKKMIISIGSLIEIKGFHTLLNAAKIVCKIEKDIIFVIIGEGPLKIKLIELAKKNGIEKNVIFTGFVPYKKTPQFFAASDIFVHPSNVESMGRVILEAEASGKPVIATNIGGIPEAVNEHSAILVPSKNPEILAKGILNLLKNETLSKKMGQEGRKLAVTEFEFWKQEEKLVSYYKKVLNEFRSLN